MNIHQYVRWFAMSCAGISIWVNSFAAGLSLNRQTPLGFEGHMLMAVASVGLLYFNAFYGRTK